jgi:hypothetical protein
MGDQGYVSAATGISTDRSQLMESFNQLPSINAQERIQQRPIVDAHGRQFHHLSMSIPSLVKVWVVNLAGQILSIDK